MPTNLETFVKTLESEGVDAGKKAAQKIEAEAHRNAEQIIAEAKVQAEQIIGKANSEAKTIKSRMDSSLELAARDAVLMLRQKISEQLKTLLRLNVEKALNNEETLISIVNQVIPAFAKPGVEKQTTEINFSSNLKSNLLQGALKELANSLNNKNIEINIKQNLSKAGFEFKIEGSTIEVSTESVAEMLAEMIDPDLQKFLANASSKGK